MTRHGCSCVWGALCNVGLFGARVPVRSAFGVVVLSDFIMKGLPGFNVTHALDVSVDACNHLDCASALPVCVVRGVSASLRSC